MRDLKKWLGRAAIIGTSALLLSLFAVSVMIGHSVRDRCREAESEYGGDCVESLMSLVDDERKSYRSRNDAIWALGQLGDSRALPTLRKYYTGNIPSHEPYDGTISQYELKKATHLTAGGFNVTAVFWRYGVA